jgi:hypothetical protein
MSALVNVHTHPLCRKGKYEAGLDDVIEMLFALEILFALEMLG